MCDMSSIDRSSGVGWLFREKTTLNNTKTMGNGENYLSFGANIHIFEALHKAKHFEAQCRATKNIFIIAIITFSTSRTHAAMTSSNNNKKTTIAWQKHRDSDREWRDMKNYFVKRDASKILIRSALRGKKRRERENIHNNIISVIIGFVEHRKYSSQVICMSFDADFFIKCARFLLSDGAISHTG